MGQFVAHHFHVRGHVQVQVWRQVTLGTPSTEATQCPWRVCQEIRVVTSLPFLGGVSNLNIKYALYSDYFQKINEIFPCRRNVWVVSGG